MFQEPPPEPGFRSRTSLIQLAYGVWVNLTMVVIGLTFGFTAVALPQLSLSNSDISTSVSDQAWITSVLTILSPFGCVITGYLVDKVGRRIMLILCHLPVAIGWFCTAMASSAKAMIIGRMVTGFGVGMIVVAPRPYLSEISLPNMRGVIGTFPNLALSIGVIIQAGLGSFCKWQTLCYICMVYSLILMFCNYFLPETPHYLLMTSTIDKAEASLRKFRSADYNIEAEIEELTNFKMDNDIHRLTWKEKIVALFKRSSCKPFFIIIVYFIITQFSGVSVMTMWTVEILKLSKSSVDAHTGNILLGGTRFVSGIFMSIIIFRVGRRPLALISSLGLGATLIIVGRYIIFTQRQTVLPQICYMACIVFSALGYYTLPVLIMSELYPLQVRGFLGGISTSINYLLIFAVNKLYPHMIEAFGFPYAIIFFGIVSLLGCVFLYFFLPETKGLKLQDIEEYYNSRRPTLTSERQVISSSQLQFDAHGLHRDDNFTKSSIDKNTRNHKESDKHNVTISESTTERKDDGSTSQELTKKKEG